MEIANFAILCIIAGTLLVALIALGRAFAQIPNPEAVEDD